MILATEHGSSLFFIHFLALLITGSGGGLFFPSLIVMGGVMCTVPASSLRFLDKGPTAAAAWRELDPVAVVGLTGLGGGHDSVPSHSRLDPVAGEELAGLGGGQKVVSSSSCSRLQPVGAVGLGGGQKVVSSSCSRLQPVGADWLLGLGCGQWLDPVVVGGLPARLLGLGGRHDSVPWHALLAHAVTPLTSSVLPPDLLRRILCSSLSGQLLKRRGNFY